MLRPTWFSTVGILFLLVLSVPPAQAQSTYSTIVLSGPGTVRGITGDSTAPQVFGLCDGHPCTIYPVRQVFTPLTGPTGFGRIEGAACGVLVGSSTAVLPQGSPAHAMQIDLEAKDNPATPQDERMTDLGTLEPGVPASASVWSSFALGVNCAGTVVGFAPKAGGPALPVKWEDGVIAELPLPAGASRGSANAINDVGDITGHADNRCVVWPAAGGVVSCHTGGAGASEGVDIDDDGRVAVSGSQGALWTAATGAIVQPPLVGDTVSTLRRLGVGGRVIGTSSLPNPNFANPPDLHEAATLWQDNVGLDLNTQIAQPGLVLLQGLGLTPDGVFLARATQAGQVVHVLGVPDAPTRREKRQERREERREDREQKQQEKEQKHQDKRNR